MWINRNPVIAVLLCVIWASAASAADKPPMKVTFDEHVLPLFREKCLTCHNQDKKSAGLNLTNYTATLEGGSGGKILEPGDPDNSSLYLVVAHKEQPYMPPKSPKLPDPAVETIRLWIQQGALENSGSKPRIINKPKFDIALTSAAVGKPEGPPPMPQKLSLEPVTRTSRANAVTAVASSPWAPLVAVGGQKQVLLYNADTCELLGVLPFPEGVPHVLKFSRNGSLLLAGGGRGSKEGRVVVWSVTTGERIFQVGEELDSVLAADISADQTQIALAGPGKIVRVYSTKDGSLIHELKKHTDWVYALEFSPDGVLLATSDRNGGVFVWETNSGREYVSIRGHTAAVTDVSWRVDSNVLATCSEDSTIRLWELENGNQIKSWGAHGGGCQSVEFARDGRLVSAGRDRVVKVWDQNGAQQRSFEAFPDVALRCVFSHDGNRVIGGDWTGQLRVWTVADGKQVGSLSANPPTLAEQIEAAAKAVAEAKTKSDQLAAAAAASMTNLQKAQADLAAAQKAVTDLAAAAKAAADAVPKAKAALDQANANLAAAQAAVPVKDGAAKLLAEAAAKSKEAAAKLKDNKEVNDFAAKSQEVAGKAAADLAAAQKAVTDLTASIKPLTDQHNAAQATAQKAAADAAAAPKVVEARMAAIKPATDKANADKAVADQAAAAYNQAKAIVDRLTAAKAQASR